MKCMLLLTLLISMVAVAHGDVVYNGVLKYKERKAARKAAAQGLPPKSSPQEPPPVRVPKRQRDPFASNDHITRLPDANRRTNILTSKEHQLNQAAFHRTSKYQKDTRQRVGARPALDPEAAKKHLSEDERESLSGRKHVEQQMRVQAKEMTEALQRQRKNPEGWRQRALNQADEARKRVSKALTYPTRLVNNRQLRKSHSMPELRVRPVM